MLWYLLLLLLMQIAMGRSCFETEVDFCTINEITTNIDRRVNPCSNFWAYACGNWKTQHKDDDNFVAVANIYNEKLQMFLEEQQTHSSSTTSKLWTQLQTYYNACSSTIAQRILPDQLPEQLNWLRKLLDFEAEASYTDWLHANALLRRYGLNAVFIDETVGVSYNNSLRYAVQLSMPAESEYFESKTELKTYFTKYGIFVNTNQDIMELATQLYALDTKLAMLSAKYRTEASIEEIHSLATLKRRIPQIDWQSYFDIILDQQAPEDLRIEVADIAYMQEVALFLKHTEPRLINYYLLLRFCKSLFDYLPKERTNKACIAHMNAILPLGMNYIYNRYIYATQRHEDERHLQQIFEDLKTTFRDYINENKLRLNPKAQQYLHNKLREMRLVLGNLPSTAKLDALWFDEYYLQLNLSATNFQHNLLEALHFRTSQQHKLLLSNEGRVNLVTYYVNDDLSEARSAPYFVHQRNMLIVPLCFMQLPFFHQRQNVIFRYSLLGWILAHEMNHGFELDGVIFDAAGNETPMGFAIRNQLEFQAAHDCLNRSTVNGMAVLKERLADVNGFQLVYDAFFKGAGARFAENLIFDGIIWSSRQLFYLNFAQFFCGNLPEALEHDRDDVRVNMVVGNMPEFVRDFKCELKSAHPPKACQMWRKD